MGSKKNKRKSKSLQVSETTNDNAADSSGDTKEAAGSVDSKAVEADGEALQAEPGVKQLAVVDTVSTEGMDPATDLPRSSQGRNIPPVDGCEVVDGYDIEYAKKLPRDIISFSASADSCGGGTGKEFVSNLGNTARQDWNKWMSGGPLECSITQRFTGGAYLTKYALCSANDCPSRDPDSWILRGKKYDTGEWVTLHVVGCGEATFSERWQWLTFSFPTERHGKFSETVLQLRTDADADALQLGHWHFEQELHLLN
jgi:hypothetical protein